MRTDCMERVHLTLYALVMRRIHIATSKKTRQILETIHFVVFLHAVALLVLLHMSFSSATHSTSCLVPFLSPTSATAPLVRIEIVTPPVCASDLTLSCVQRPQPLASYVFASQRELLALWHSSNLHHTTSSGDLPVIHVPRSSACFDLRWIGQHFPLWDLLLDHALGYNTIMMNHVSRWHERGGVLLNEASGRIFEIRAVSSQHLTWETQAIHRAQTLFLCVAEFCICISLVGFVGHELIKRSLKFSGLIRHRQAFANHEHLSQAIYTHWFHSVTLVPIVLGMILFLLELYHQDYVLGFGVLAIVSVGETFSIIWARSPLSQHYFPRLFFCWFALFHIYLSPFPNGFSHFAMLVLEMAMVHTVMFFVNCFEIPHFLSHTRRDQPYVTQ